MNLELFQLQTEIIAAYIERRRSIEDCISACHTGFNIVFCSSFRWACNFYLATAVVAVAAPTAIYTNTQTQWEKLLNFFHIKRVITDIGFLYIYISLSGGHSAKAYIQSQLNAIHFS